ncbi:radical SAM protein [Streptomyces sp. NPDC059629]|uniref:radical SAM protein n=1 Tax=Streptomyces sp. NPDC059629 TaxID=3346889 RepID=UPI00368D9CBC
MTDIDAPDTHQITATARPRPYWSATKALWAAMESFGSPEGVRDEVDIRPAPWSLELYPTMACSIACHFCYAQNRNEEYGFTSMPVEMMDRLHRSIESMGVRGVQYCGGGEPLQWRGGRIADYIARLPRETTRAGMASNMLRGRALARPDVLDRMVFLEVNVCGFDNASYAEVTGSSDGHERMAAAVAEVLAARERHGLATPVVNAKILISNRNHQHLRAMYEWAESAGFDNIHLRLVDDYEKIGGFVLDSDQREEFRTELVALARERGLTEWLDQAGLILGEDNKGVRRDHRWCRTVANGLNCWVLSNGEVYVCGPQWGQPQYLIGDLKEADLEEIWGGPRHVEVAERLIRNMGLSRCYEMGCRHIKQTQAIDAWRAGEVPMPQPQDFEQRHAWFL